MCRDVVVPVRAYAQFGQSKRGASPSSGAQDGAWGADITPQGPASTLLTIHRLTGVLSYYHLPTVSDIETLLGGMPACHPGAPMAFCPVAWHHPTWQTTSSRSG